MVFTDALLTLRGRATTHCRTSLRLVPVLLLCGCADVRLPSVVFADGPPPAAAAAQAGRDPIAVLTGQRPIRRIDTEGADYPNLASVPPRPTDFSSPVERQAALDALQAERAAGREAGQAVRGAVVPGGADAGRVPAPQVPAAPPAVPRPVQRPAPPAPG